MEQISRRFFLRLSVGSMAALLANTSSKLVAITAGQDLEEENHIEKENQQPGTLDWESDELRQGSRPIREEYPSIRAADVRAQWVDTPIRGYASQASITRGQTITFYVSTNRPTYTLEVYRIGWYGGTGARRVMRLGPLRGQNQPVPPPARDTGLLACSWRPSYTLRTDANWVTGVYLVKLISSANEIAYILFVLRDDSLPAPILYQVPLTTYQAYNNWGGKSLYEFNSTGGLRAYKVSFDRPYSKWAGAGDFFEGDYNMIRWLEARGYRIAYATSVDTHTTSNLMNRHKVFLSNWHDEYWSRPMRHHVTVARDRGKHLAFFDSNNIYWQIRFESSASGVPNRVIACYKEASRDPLSRSNPSLTTVTWREAPVNQPENALLGVMCEDFFNYDTSYPWVVRNADHWIYAGTGLRDGQAIPGLVGYEYDKVFTNGRTPAGLTVLAASPVSGNRVGRSTHNGVIYTAPSGALVFTAGTNYWPWKLDDNTYQRHGADARVRRMTANLLNTMIGR